MVLVHSDPTFFLVILVDFRIKRLSFFAINFLVNIGFPKIESGVSSPACVLISDCLD